MMRNTITVVSLLALAAGVVGCHARSPEDYAKVTQQLLETKGPEIKACYDGILKTDATAQGTVASSSTWSMTRV